MDQDLIDSSRRVDVSSRPGGHLSRLFFSFARRLFRLQLLERHLKKTEKDSKDSKS